MGKRLGIWLVVAVLCGCLCGAAAGAQDAPADVVSATPLAGALIVARADGTVERTVLENRETSLLGQFVLPSDADMVADVAALRAANGTTPVFDFLFSGEEMLYGLCTLDGVLYQLLDAAGDYAPQRLAVTLDISPFWDVQGDIRARTNCLSLFVQNGFLYYVSTPEPWAAEYNAGCLSLQTGEKRAFTTRFIRSLSPWKDGLLLATVLNPATPEDEQTGAQSSPEYGWFDPQMDAFMAQGRLRAKDGDTVIALRGACANAARDTLYYTDGDHVLALSLGTDQVHVSALLGGGQVDAMFSTERIWVEADHYIRFVDREANFWLLDSPELAGGVLRVYGEYGSPEHKSFSREHPDIPTETVTGRGSDIDTLVAAMLTQSDTLDVLNLNMGYRPVLQLMQKGYCTDFSTDAEIMQIVSQMNPKFTAAVTWEGRLCAVPVGFDCSARVYNRALWQQLGLSDAQVPDCWEALLRFMAQWAATAAGEHPGVQLWSSSPARLSVLASMLADYATTCRVAGEAVTFDTPEVQALMDAYEAIDFQAIDGDGDWSAPVPVNGASLFGTFSVNQLVYWEPDTVLMPLPIEPGKAAVLRADPAVLLVNPRTTLGTQARLYVLNYLQNLSAGGAAITLFPGQNTPVESLLYRKERARGEEELKRLQEQLEAAAESEQAGLQESIRWVEENLQALEGQRYDVSPERIAQYREQVEPNLWVNADSSLFTGWREQEEQLLMQYLQGSMTSQQLLTALDRQQRMQALEAQ